MKASFSFRVTIVMVIIAAMCLVLLHRDNSCGGQCSASHGEEEFGTRWAILLAGSKEFENYRHQADICHAYHLLKRGGLRDENIVVFMYDDIAYNNDNPIPGMLFNKPYGTDVYSGVPKDYTGEEVNTKNFLAVLLGNSYAITGGSGKVVDSSHYDYIFIYYSDHGNVGYLAMPSGPPLKSVDLMNALKKKHSVGGYKSMVIYVEACKSGSMFKRLPKGLSIYVLTASRAEESSYATHCSLMSLSGKRICLADQFSASWMEHSEYHNLDVATLHQQYEVVKRWTKQGRQGSHVMQFGDRELGKDSLSMYMGSNRKKKSIQQNYFGAASSSPEMTQDDATLLYYCYKLYNQNTSAPLQCPLSHGPVLVGSEKYVGLPPVETGESQSI